MSEVIYVIVTKADGKHVKGGGPRVILAYTTEGRAIASMKRNGFTEDRYEVAEFTTKGSD